MFDSDVGQDIEAKKMTRRVFVAGAATVAASLAVLALRKSPGVEASATVHGSPGEVTIVNFSSDGKNLGRQTVAKIVKSDGEWRRQLGKNSFDIAREADTEMPYSGVSLNEHGRGTFAVSAATQRCSVRRRNSSRARVGQASGRRLQRITLPSCRIILWE
jgi:peptide-methionine (R)-S-oxide reductase